ncbi:cell wall protein DAN4-like [Patiria miniata]|uniref:Uncharacterized protein n=1 Tax=Patiria miniata TaxID=46514 RepID=A0A914BTX3_PATMI|nr:cell wall protein DAN4-like [Patiria miniata]
MMMMMMTTMCRMHWFLWLSVVACHLGLTSSGYLTTAATGVMPSADYTVSVDVTAASSDVTETVVSEDDALSDTSLPLKLTETNVDRRNMSSTENTTVGISIGEDVESTVFNISKQDENMDSKESGTSESQRNPTTGMVYSTVKPFTADTSETSTASPQEGSYSPKPLTQTQTLVETSTSQPESLHTNVSITSVSLNKNLKDIFTPTSKVSERILNSTGAEPTLEATTNVDTSFSSVPDEMTQHVLDTIRPSDAPSTEATPTTSTSSTRTSTSENNIARLTVPLTTSDFLASITKTTKSTSYTQRVTEKLTTTTDDRDDVEDETDSHEETAYERSLRTRRVINHAALWITIGFVVVLVSYITVLVIYNRMRPEWQDPQHPYSRFENESDDFPDSNENNMDCENQGLIEDNSERENRRDFSQCVDPRDFPPCEGSHEYLLYEDPTVMDENACEDFSYRD